MNSDQIRFYEFGEFRLDARKRLLLKNGEHTQISPRIFDLLLVLVQNEGEILGHDDLLDKVWDGMFVEQSNLKKSVSALRQILGEHPDERLYVQTVPRRGYSFVAPVRRIEADAPDRAVYLRETHTEIIVEEIEESDETASEPLRLSPAPLSGGFRETLIRHKVLIAAGLILLTAAVGYGLWAFGSKSRTQFAFDNIKITRLTSLGNLSGAVISPDGKYVLYASVGSGESSLWLQQTSVGNATQLVPKMPASHYFYGFSADGNYVTYTVENNPDASQNGFFRIPLLGGAPERLAGKASTASPDGSMVVYNTRIDDRTGIAISKADGSAERLLTTLGREYRIWDMRWTPDGKAVLLALRKFTADKIVHYVVEYPIDGGAEKIVVPEMDKQITSAVWLPDKSSLLLCLREVNAEIRQIWQYFPATGELKRVTNDYSSYYSMSLTRDGRSVVTTMPNRLVSIWVSDDKFDFKQTTSGASYLDKVGWMADGKLVFSAVNNGAEAVYLIDTDGKDQRPVTKGEDGIWLVPRVSGDGRSILFNSTRTGRKQLWRSDAEGRTMAYLTNVSDQQIFDGKLLADDQTVLFRSEGDGLGMRMYEKLPDGTVKTLTDFETGAWDISPDEKQIAYRAVDKADGKTHLFIRALDGGDPLRSYDVGVGGDIRWTRDGKALTYIVDTPDAGEIFLQPTNGGAAKLLAKFPGERIFSFDWSFDGKRLAVIRGKLLTDAVMISNETVKN